VRKGIQELGAILLFTGEALAVFFRRGVNWHDVVDQMYAVGVRSLSTTTVTGLFVGAIMAVQINLELRDFGAQGALGGLATSVTIRTVGPVLIAFILSGKVGAYTSAELGTMRVTDQVDAIRCLGTDPIEYLIVPRLVAVVLSSFLLLIVGLMMTIAGGMIVAGLQLSINPTNYTDAIPRFVTGGSVLLGVVKSFCFGTLIAVLACYRGYTASGGAVGVGRTVKSTAVQTLVAIIVADYLLTIFAGVAVDWGQR
jgi:phospholipid/cholesterol/gamma-HCH transport system permease protein